MSELETTLLSATVGAAVGAAFAAAGMLLNSWLTQRRERRQQVWRIEVDRIIQLEERAGRLVECVSRHRGAEQISDEVAEELPLLADDAGRFLRHDAVSVAVRDLHHALALMLADKLAHRDDRENAVQVKKAFDSLLKSCDAVTRNRKF